MTHNCSKPFYKFIGTLALLCTLAACNNLQPRKPVNRTTSSRLDILVETDKKRYAAEEAAIEQLLEQSNIAYQRSNYGFYYHFTHKDSLGDRMAQIGDRVTFSYNVIKLNGDTIYNTSELSPITKSLEQEYGIFKGMRKALKLMHEGDQASFYFPSYMGYGSYGDKNRIDPHTPFKSDVKLIAINKEK